ncbi:type VI secretion system membrane subunit TssM [Xanthomonas cerealis pv. cerealis]|uniref:type VI secretion system membrane subunit TssM n=1 Tax=Xanthomonas cerealis TaxID=3390025 RepID=UPI001EFF7944|nr:type VI secretion system membrane subunit TssM [Xanthomonas translucens]UKE68203.1 type VI secretion system membrane subunit TssM [Xanthomonas translucens pv. pistacia]
MFSNLRYYLRDYRLWMVLGLLAAAAVAYFGAEGLREIGLWAAAVLAVCLTIWLLVWIVRRIIARRAARSLDAMVQGEADRAVAAAQPANRADTEALRSRMLEAVKAIKSSRLGVLKGKAALYELPWYVIIGNPAAGKSTAILNSGLQFPFEDNRGNVIQGIGGTRNCDWYFTTTGIVLDTAGRYSVSVEDRLEWLTFLALLKKHRPRAPINGIIIAASIAELSGSKPEFAIELAKNLRQRVQEITERLEVFAPVYVVFTKADLIAGFSEFFHNLDPSERENVWGATLPYDPTANTDALAAFDTHFDELAEGLKEMSLAHMAMQRGRQVSPGLLTLPLEFVGIKPALRTFIATLFEENPYQFKPVFRGFYFSSALQEGHSVHHASERVSRQFALQARAQPGEAVPSGQTAYFLKDLFRKVIFADKQLVRQYSSPHQNRLRYGVFLGGVAVLALALGLWTWSYTTNVQLVNNATKDLDQAVRVQANRVDLQSRIDALLLLQDRLEQLDRYKQKGGITSGLGLYQGGNIRKKLLAEYYNGMRQVMLEPTTANLESFLGQVVSERDRLGKSAGPQQAAQQGSVLYQDASPTDTNDAYNALKTYLMLGNRKHVESAHLTQQLTLFWRGWLDANRGQMTREEMTRAAEKLMTFYVAQAEDAQWPQVQTKVTLVNDSREALTRVMKGQPAMQRVFAQIKARAAARFPTVTVNALIGEEANSGAITGSYAISGAFSREAWEEYVKDAIKEAANTQLSTTDWVLDTSEQSDLSLAGSPEHVARELVTAYKQEYAQEWRKFIQGVSVAPFQGFDQALSRMNRIGDPANSPLRKLLEKINEQTIWDNPMADALSKKASGGAVAWFQRVILRRDPADAGKAEQQPVGPIGKTFEGLARLMTKRKDEPAVIDAYFDKLAKLRTRMNAIKNQGQIGVGARKLMQDTFSNEGSELSAALTLVDEQMLTGLDETQRDAMRPLLLRPLTQTFAALVPPTEGEINRVWAAQVYEPFRNGIGQRYPFNLNTDVDAAPGDVAAIFGASGAIAAFNKDALGTLVIQRGNLLESRRWAGIGITLSSELVANYGNWVSGQSGAVAKDVSIFELLPTPAVGAIEYTIDIDGQTLRYRNTPPQWMTMQWPNAGAVPGAKITAVTSDGRSVEMFNAPGKNGLKRLLTAAAKESLDDVTRRFTWSDQGVSISVQLRIVQNADTAAGGGGDWQRGLQLPATVAGSPTTVGADAPRGPVPAGAPAQEGGQ